MSTPDRVIGRVPAVTILAGQMVTTNLLASSTEGGQFSVLGPDESVGPDTPVWRAISLTVPDDRAVGGLLTPNQTVDVFVTASINVLTSSEVGIGEEGYYSDRSTKISYQNMLILAKAGQSYILKAPIDVAEEISHLQATGASSLQLRPAARRRHPPGRRVPARDDDQRGDHPLRAADPGRVSVVRRTAPDRRTDADRHPRPDADGHAADLTEPLTLALACASLHLRAADPAHLQTVRAASCGPGGRSIQEPARAASSRSTARDRVAAGASSYR